MVTNESILKVSFSRSLTIGILVFIGENKTLDVACNLFLPEFKESKIFIGGSGQATYIKKIRVTQVARDNQHKLGGSGGALFMANGDGASTSRDCCSLF